MNDILIKIWGNQIKESYERGEICSERHLQAELYYQFKKCPELSQYQIWMEPTLGIYDGTNDKGTKIGSITPDILISCNDVLKAMIEIKYRPYGQVHYKFDIEKFNTFQKYKPKITIETNPTTGRHNNTEIEIGKDTLFVFAVIANADRNAIALKKERWTDVDLPNKFLHLIGKISTDPNLYEFYSDEIKIVNPEFALSEEEYEKFEEEKGNSI
jgi:hypothetical protein